MKGSRAFDFAQNLLNPPIMRPKVGASARVQGGILRLVKGNSSAYESLAV